MKWSRLFFLVIGGYKNTGLGLLDSLNVLREVGNVDFRVKVRDFEMLVFKLN